MKLTSFNSKLLNPFHILLIKLFHFPSTIKSFKFPSFHNNNKRRRTKRKRFLSLRIGFRRQTKNSDTLGKMKSFGEPLRSPNSSLARLSRVEEEEACRSFESYLVEMIVEEGKVRDLMDVEELLYCWNSLNSPVFIELVSTFYGELCRDLFSHRKEQFKVVHDFM